jgi:hypothetical protein
VPSPLGLKVVLDKRGKPRHSVRGIIEPTTGKNDSTSMPKVG